jgi:hypothetical protein
MSKVEDRALFDDATYKKLPEKKRFLYVYEWLTYLDKNLSTFDKLILKKLQQKLIEQLIAQFYGLPGSILRVLIAKNIVSLYKNGDIYVLYDIIEKCKNVIKFKDDSHANSIAKLCSLRVIAEIYTELGSMIGGSHEDTINILLKLLKICDTNTKQEVLYTFKSIISGISYETEPNIHRNIYKCLKTYFTDKTFTVRLAALKVNKFKIQFKFSKPRLKGLRFSSSVLKNW